MSTIQLHKLFLLQWASLYHVLQKSDKVLHMHTLLTMSYSSNRTAILSSDEFSINAKTRTILLSLPPLMMFFWAEFAENWFGAGSPVKSLFAQTAYTFLFFCVFPHFCILHFFILHFCILHFCIYQSPVNPIWTSLFWCIRDINKNK